MAKNSIRDFSATSSSNTDIQSVDIDENCAASGINNAIRELMADLKDVSTGTVNLETPAADRLDVDNIRIDGNTISSTDTNGDLTLSPNGTGDTIIASGNLGVGTASPSELVHVVDGDPIIRLEDSDAPSGTYNLINANGASGRLSFSADDGNTASGSHMRFLVDGSEAVRINEDGAVLVGKIANNSTSVGANIRADKSFFTSDDKEALVLNRNTSDGKIIEFRKDNAYVGQIDSASSGSSLTIGTNDTGFRFAGAGDSIRPHNPSTGSDRDNAIDLGSSSQRFDDIFATNGSIQTSDQNEKQQIASLTTAEITAAKALSKLFKTFKWNSAVTAKGDEARTHTGHIAQEVQTAMTDAGLDAADYAFWCSDTWWETSTDVPAVEAVAEVLDDDGNVVTEAVEARDAYTRIDHYDTAEEAPEGATQRTRLGVRYPELLAFIGAATEQRLADIETRLTALEA